MGPFENGKSYKTSNGTRIDVSKGGGTSKISEQNKSPYSLPTAEANRRFNK